MKESAKIVSYFIRLPGNIFLKIFKTEIWKKLPKGLSLKIVSNKLLLFIEMCYLKIQILLKKILCFLSLSTASSVPYEWDPLFTIFRNLFQR
jgi:hypothetical protein